MDINFADVNWWAQIPFILAAILLLVRMIVGVKRGFIKEICSLISVIIASIAVVLIAFGVRNFFSHEVVLVVAAIVCILLLGIIYKLLEVFFVSLKLIAKLPVVNLLDKLLGIIIGIAETILVVWAVYCIITIMQPSAFGNWIINCVKNNNIMKFLYVHNILFDNVSVWFDKILALDIPGKIGFKK